MSNKSYNPTEFEGDENNNPNGVIINKGTEFPDSYSDTVTNKDTKKLTGFLVSYSKDGNGESWPLHLGSNTIGTGKDNVIILREKSVSNTHAHIGIRRLSNAELVYELMDKGSSTGTIVNEKDHSEYNNYIKLSNGDNIKIGGYHLVFIAIDDKKLGLSKNDSFKSSIPDIPDYTI